MGIPDFYALTGPTSGVAGVAQTYTLTPQGSITDTVSLSVTGGATLSVASLSFSSSAAAQHFTLTAPASGSYTLTLTSPLGDTINGSPWAFTATPGFNVVQTCNAVSNGQVNSFTATFLRPVTAGNLLVAIPMAFHGASLPSGVNCIITDSGGNTWQGNNFDGITVVFPTTSNQITFNVFWSVVTVGGALVITSSPSATEFCSLTVLEISGAGNNFSLAAALVGSGGSSASPAVGNVPVDGSNLVIGAFAQFTLQSSSWTPGAGYTAVQNTQIVGSSQPIAFLTEYLANTSTNPATPVATLPSSAFWVAAGFALTPTPSVVTTAYVWKSGTAALFGTAAKGGLSNGAWPLANITAINATPVISVNGAVVSIGPATWMDVVKNIALVAYRLNCGSVRSIPMSACGQNYTSPSASASGGGGSGLTLGTPILGVGITSYTITAPGSGIGNGASLWQVPGGTFTNGFFKTSATAFVTVSGGVVTSVVPANGAVQGMGAAYDPSVASFAATFGNATITCNVSHYIQSVPVTNPGSGYTSPPTITFTDSTGSGAVAAPIMNGPTSSDTVTYTVADGWLKTALGSNGGATNGAMANFVGQLEGPNGNLNGFRGTPTIKLGGQFGAGATNSQQSYLYFGKNKLKSAAPWHAGSGTSSLTLDSNFFPVSWTPAGTIACQFYADAAGAGCVATGTGSLIYDDEFYAVPSRAPAPTSVTLTGVNSMGAPVITGTTVTIPWTISPQNQVDFCDIELSVVAPSDGLWHLKDQAGVSNPWVVGPGNTTDRSKPFAADDAMVAALTGPGGSVPACFRVMDTFGSSGGWQNWISGSDFPPITTFSYAIPSADAASRTIPGTPPFSAGNPLPSGTAIFQFARFLNTNPASTTYAWSSPRLYSTDGWANSGTDSFGNYLDMTAGPNGANDNGSFLVGAPAPNSGILELRSTSPHGLRSRQLVSLFADPEPCNIPWTGGFGTLPFLFPNPGGSGALHIYVTGPNTIILTYGIGTGGTGTATQTVNSTTEVPVSIAAQVQVPQAPQTMPIEALAGVVSSFPGSAAWVNLPQIGDDSIYTTMAQKIAAHIGPTNDVVLEFGNEHWNSANAFHEFPSEITAKNLGRYMPSGKTLYGYWPTTGGDIASDGTGDLFYTLKANHAYDVFTTAWVAAGLSASRIKRMHGMQWGGGDGGKNARYYSTYSIPAPFGNVVAPYQGLPPGGDQNFTLVTAFTGAGYPGYPGGNWPCDAINDMIRHLAFYSTDNWGWWQGQNSSLPSGGTRMCCYESGYNIIIPEQIPFAKQLSEDCLFHPSFYDAVHGYELALQQGNPLIPNSGPVLQSYFNFWNDQGGIGQDLWHLGAGFSQAQGLGLSNSFNTPQGGLAQARSANGVWPEGYATVNQAPAMQLLRDWNAATASAAPSTTATLSGPTSGPPRVASANFTVALDGTTYPGTITPSDSGAGGTFTPTSLTWSGTAQSQTFTYTPAATGAHSISISASPTLTISGSPVTYTSAAIGYALSGASNGFDGVPITLTVTPSGVATDTVTLSDGSGGGTFSPSATLTFSGSGAPQTPTYTPGSTGTKSITATSTAGGTVTGSPLSISVAARGYTVTGATTGFVGNSIAYTVTPSGATTDTMTFSDASGGGTFSPTSLGWSDTSNTQTVHYTPASAGTKTLTFTSGDGGTVIGSPVSLVVSLVGYTLSGSTSGTTGNAITYTVTPASSATDTITLSHSGSAGTLSPTTLTFTASATPQTFAFTPSAAGTATITAASTNGGTITGQPVTVTVSIITHAKAKKYIVGNTRHRIR